MVLSAETMPAPGLASSAKAAILAELSKPTCNHVSIQRHDSCHKRAVVHLVTVAYKTVASPVLKTGERVLVVNVHGYSVPNT